MNTNKRKMKAIMKTALTETETSTLITTSCINPRLYLIDCGEDAASNQVAIEIAVDYISKIRREAQAILYQRKVQMKALLG